MESRGRRMGEITGKAEAISKTKKEKLEPRQAAASHGEDGKMLVLGAKVEPKIDSHWIQNDLEVDKFFDDAQTQVFHFALLLPPMPLTVGSDRLQVADITGNCFALSLKNSVCCSNLAWSDSPLARSLARVRNVLIELPSAPWSFFASIQTATAQPSDVVGRGRNRRPRDLVAGLLSVSAFQLHKLAPGMQLEASRRDAPHPTTVYKAIINKAQGPAQVILGVRRNGEGMCESQLFLSLLPPLMSYRARSFPTKDDAEVEDISSPSVVQINGGTFNLTVQREEKEFQNFRRIRLGDIVLGKDVGGGARRVDGRNVVRRVYTAKIVEMELPMTVAIYEGQEKDLKEKWDEYIALHVGLRHPNVFPLFGITLSQGLCAAIYHDVIAAMLAHDIHQKEEFEVHDLNRCDFHAAPNSTGIVTKTGSWLLYCVNDRFPSAVYLPDIRDVYILVPSVREDLYRIEKKREIGFAGAGPDGWGFPPQTPTAARGLPLAAEARCMVLTLAARAHCVALSLAAWPTARSRLTQGFLIEFRTIPLSRHSSVRPHSLVKHGDGNLQEIAFHLQVNSDLPKWSAFVNDAIYGDTNIMPNGWTCVLLSGNDILGASFRLPFKIIKARGDQTSPSYPLFRQLFAWFAQANYIFDRLGLECSSCSYIDSICVDCGLTGYIQSRSPEKIFLFLPPYRTFLSADSTRYGFPREEPYLSFDPRGKDRLSANEALNLGLPQARIDISVAHHFVDDAFLKDLRTFHAREGFDPDSQEIAEHLGLALYCFADSEDPSPLPISWPEPVDFVLIAECSDCLDSSHIAMCPKNI
ncbi:hypothetical protein R3P38DRAFT_3530643 [Favolaschia claudopus]|uniref:Protein kinase domain-containing protein n=1 Tax=Favolaschia claudopus TaxID=2862362 RepID=A0AAW0BIW8_9AGAR